jgi:hypothetical protein
VNTLPTNPFAAALMVCGWRKLQVEGSGKFPLGDSHPGCCIRNMNPYSTCYLYDEMLRVKYTAYPNMEKKNCIHMAIENLNIKLKYIYIMINILKRKYAAWIDIFENIMLIHKTCKICTYMHHQTMSKITKWIHTYIQMSILFWLQERNMHLH